MDESRNLVIPGEPALDAELWVPAGTGPFPTVVCAHGLLSARQEFSELPATLAQRGILVLAFDFSGNGKSGGVRSFHTAAGHLGDLERALVYLLDQTPADPSKVVLLGHSLGSVPVLKLLGQDGGRFQGGVLVAPMNNPAAVLGLGERIFYHAAFLVARQWHELTGFHLHVPYQFTYRHLFADPDARRAAQRQGFLQRSISLLNYPYVIEGVDNAAVAAKVKVPALVVVGSEDRVIPNEQSRQVYEALACNDKEWIKVVGAGHSLFGDRGAREVCDRISTWIANRLGVADKTLVRISSDVD